MFSPKSLERAVLGALQRNVLVSQVELARMLGVSRQRVADKMDSLEKAKVIKGYTTIIDPRALGFNIIAITGAAMEHGKTERITSAINSMNQVYLFLVTTGVRNCKIFSVHRDTESLHHFVDRQLGAIDGLSDIDSQISLRSYWKTGSEKPQVVESPSLKEMLVTDLDRRILAILQSNARVSVSKISRKVGSSMATVKKRIDYLKENGVILFSRLDVEYSRIGLPIVGSIEIKIEYSDVGSTVKEILQCEEVSIVNEITGRYDLHVSVLEPDINSLRNFLSVKLGRISGYKESATSLILEMHQKYRI